MTPAGFLRDAEARTAAVRRYAQAHDRFAELEQVARLTGEIVESEGAHRYALICLRAVRAELDDPEPEGSDG